MKQKDKKKISFQTTGCRLNQYETERMAADLLPFGFARAAKGEPADLYIINTCTITHRADSSSRYLINRAARENPQAPIVVAGCYVDSDGQKVSRMDSVDAVIGNSEKERIAEILPERFPDLFPAKPDTGCFENVADFQHYNRAWLKISDGCNQWCSFCILPHIRGRLRNRPPLDLIREVNVLYERGFREVVLTGIHLGHYRNRRSEPQARNLAHLCRMILEETDIPRIRISSIEPQTIRDELLQLLADSAGRVCPHMHLPLQSGSSRILRLMRRPYDQNVYLDRVKSVKEVQPHGMIGADVIVGFPGETDDDFEKTRRVVESGYLDYLHVFSYSDRKGTTASEIKEKVNPETIKERSSILTEISKRLRAKAHQRQVGRVLSVISENSGHENSDSYGIAGNYVRVKIPRQYAGGREILDIRVTEAHDDHVDGDLVTD